MGLLMQPGVRDSSSSLILGGMTVREVGVYRGPHYYSHTPMIRMQVDIGALEQWPSNRLPGFTDRLLAMLPGLEHHGCSRRRKGGLVERLREGTWIGHVTEHVALELQNLAGDRVTRGKTRQVKGEPGCYNIMFAYRDEEVGRAAGRFALELVDSLLPGALSGLTGLDRVRATDDPYDFDDRLDALVRLARRQRLGPTTQSLVDEAKRRGIPVMRLDEHSLVQLGHGRKQQRLRASVSGRTSLVASESASDKHLAKSLLADAGIPVPRGQVVRDREAALSAARQLRFPLVTKPLDGNHGRGVTTGILDEDQLLGGFEVARQGSRRGVIVEQQFVGRDHRILVINGEVVAVAERVPARVIGDGTRTIRQLVEAVNLDPRRGEGHEKVMTRIRLEDGVEEFLANQGRDLTFVPPPGEAVQLVPTANLSTGGIAIDRTGEIHPDNAEIARRAAAVIGLDIAGVDFLAPDIAASVHETGGGVIEINAAPGFRMHIEPSEGPPRNVARPVIDMLFPDGDDGRIPIIAITGTNGKSTVARMVAHILRHDGRRVGLTSTSGVYISGRLVTRGDATGPRSARMVLRDPDVDVAVLETARGGLLREGLAFEESDIGVFLNVSADHLGLKGIETLDDLAEVKSLVVETVRRDGASILNADDPQVARMANRAGGETIWFSMQGGGALPEFLQTHIDDGRTAVIFEPNEDGGCITVHRKGRKEMQMLARDIPATIHGMARFNVANAVAAIGAAMAARVPTMTIRSALSSFQSNFEQNPGRLNVIDQHGFRVIVDYAHNPAGLTALGELVQSLRHLHRRTIAVLSVPGDRRDEDIIEMGRLGARFFDQLYFREDPGNRGRPVGQVMELMRRGACEAGADPSRIRLIVSEAEAVEAALREVGTGDLLVITPTDIEGCWKQVVGYRLPGSAPGPDWAYLVAAE